MKSSVLIPAAIRGRYSDNGSIVQRLELRPDKCTNTLTSVQKDNIIEDQVGSDLYRNSYAKFQE